MTNTVSRSDFNRAMNLLGLNHEDRGLHLISVEIERGRIMANYSSVTTLSDAEETATEGPTE